MELLLVLFLILLTTQEDTGESGVEQKKNGETLVVTALTDRCRCMWCMDHVEKNSWRKVDLR